jgi:hypothetical protein
VINEKLICESERVLFVALKSAFADHGMSGVYFGEFINSCETRSNILGFSFLSSCNMRNFNSGYLLRIALHLILVALITIKVFDWNVLNAGYGRSLTRTFHHLFGTEAMIESPENNQLFTYDEFQAATENAVNIYMNLPSFTVANLLYGYRDHTNNGGNVECRADPQTITSTTYYWSDSTHIYSYNKEINGINDIRVVFENNSDLFFKHLDSFHLSFDLCDFQYQPASYLSSSKCNYWEIHVSYKFIAQLYIEVTIDSNIATSCSGMTLDNTFDDYISSLEVVTALLCFVYTVFIFKVLALASVYLSCLPFV